MPIITAVVDPLIAATDGYDFQQNIVTSDLHSGINSASLSCNPATATISNGTESVTCTVKDKAGNSSSVSFVALYEYDPKYHNDVNGSVCGFNQKTLECTPSCTHTGGPGCTTECYNYFNGAACNQGNFTCTCRFENGDPCVKYLTNICYSSTPYAGKCTKNVDDESKPKQCEYYVCNKDKSSFNGKKDGKTKLLKKDAFTNGVLKKCKFYK